MPLDSIAQILKADTTVEVEIGAHTDNTGAPSEAERLTNLQAEAVRTYLVTRGVNFQQVQARGYGSAFPLTTDNTPRGRAANRRVEMPSWASDLLSGDAGAPGSGAPALIFSLSDQGPCPALFALGVLAVFLHVASLEPRSSPSALGRTSCPRHPRFPTRCSPCPGWIQLGALAGATAQPAASPVRAIYVNAWAFGGRRFHELVRLADRTEINAFVVDVKDDTGYLTYRSDVPTAIEIGANQQLRARDIRDRLRHHARARDHPDREDRGGQGSAPGREEAGVVGAARGRRPVARSAGLRLGGRLQRLGLDVRSGARGRGGAGGLRGGAVRLRPVPR